MSENTQRYITTSGFAAAIAIVGILIEGQLGTLMRFVGTAGVVLTGAIYALTGDVLIGRANTNDDSNADDQRDS